MHMDVAVELVKNETIKTKGKATRERHAKMRPLTVELKLSLNLAEDASKCVASEAWV